MRPLPESPLAGLLPIDWLFKASIEPVLIVDAANERIAHLNPAACSLLTDPDTLIGAPLIAAFDVSSAAQIRQCMDLALRVGSASSAPLRARGGAGSLRAQLSLVRTPRHAHLLVRLDPGPCLPERGESAVFDAMDRAPVGFLMTDSGLRVEYANRTLLEMLQEEPSAVQGTSLLRWLPLTPADCSQLRDCMAARQALTLLTTQLSRLRALPCPVAVCAIAVPEGGDTSWGFTVQDLSKFN